MRDRILEADDGIYQDQEVWTQIYFLVKGNKRFIEMCSQGRSQMPSRRKTHDANSIGIDLPPFCILSYRLDGLLCILKGAEFFLLHRCIIGDTVLYHDSGNAHFNEFFGDIHSLMADGIHRI